MLVRFTYHANWLDQNRKIQDPTEDCATGLHRERVYASSTERSETGPAHSRV